MKYNVKSFRKLIKRYESISLEEIKEAFIKVRKLNPTLTNFIPIGSEAACELTGFGNVKKCMLCKEAEEIVDQFDPYYHKCTHCLHSTAMEKGSYLSCLNNDIAGSYNQITSAKTPKGLHKAFKARAADLKKLLIKYENQQ